MNRRVKAHIATAIAICIALCAAAALLLLGPARVLDVGLPDTSDDGSSVRHEAASYLQRKAIEKAKQAVAPVRPRRPCDEHMF